MQRFFYPSENVRSPNDSVSCHQSEHLLIITLKSEIDFTESMAPYAWNGHGFWTRIIVGRTNLDIWTFFSPVSQSSRSISLGSTAKLEGKPPSWNTWPWIHNSALHDYLPICTGDEVTERSTVIQEGWISIFWTIYCRELSREGSHLILVTKYKTNICLQYTDSVCMDCRSVKCVSASNGLNWFWSDDLGWISLCWSVIRHRSPGSALRSYHRRPVGLA